MTPEEEYGTKSIYDMEADLPGLMVWSRGDMVVTYRKWAHHAWCASYSGFSASSHTLEAAFADLATRNAECAWAVNTFDPRAHTLREALWAQMPNAPTDNGKYYAEWRDGKTTITVRYDKTPHWCAVYAGDGLRHDGYGDTAADARANLRTHARNAYNAFTKAFTKAHP